MQRFNSEDSGEKISQKYRARKNSCLNVNHKTSKLWALMASYIDNDKHSIQRTIVNHMEYTLACTRFDMTNQKAMLATSHSVRDRLIENLNDTYAYMNSTQTKCVNYLSMEFLLGRLLQNALINIKLEDNYNEALHELGCNLEEMYEEEKDPALGNGGLGRLAACFLDSLATQDYPAVGYGIRYNYGMFQQKIIDGWQVEHPDYWLTFGNPWEIQRKDIKYPVRFYGKVREEWKDGKKNSIWEDGDCVLGIAYDTPIPGYNTNNCNTLRLWRAIPLNEIDLNEFNKGDYTQALESDRRAETITSVLYPNDSTMSGKTLRLKQEYFFVSCTIQDILARFIQRDLPWKELPDFFTIQLNDTHPTLAIPEFLRLLIDVYNLSYDEAWELCCRTFNYTNHTVMSEALETWSVQDVETLLPRIAQIINDINWHFLKDVQLLYKDSKDIFTRMENLSIISNDSVKKYRMANLAIIASSHVNGVSALHSEILKNDLFKYFYDMYPERFLNVTNGITPRRWLLLANPSLSSLITDLLGNEEWCTNLSLVEGLKRYQDDKEVLTKWRDIKRQNKIRLAAYIKKELGIEVNVDALFDIQIKRIHEYKRQLMNILYCIYRYHWIKGLSKEQRKDVVPRVVIFGGKAAPSYQFAKKVIKLINTVGEIVNADRSIDNLLKIVFIPDYNVSKAELIIPAAELSQHISTAGTEASGTSNMKFCLNGALIIGTYDGANIELAQRIGEENMFIFGKRTEEVNEIRKTLDSCKGQKRAKPISNELAIVLGQLASGSYGGNDLIMPILQSLIYGYDYYLITEDFDDYVRAQREVDALYKKPLEWSKKSLLNTAGTGYFSSDRAMNEYANKIWMITPTTRPVVYSSTNTSNGRQRARSIPGFSEEEGTELGLEL
ncbi:hypothetical protein WA158_001014 [Blastocystis sp. Blastoise]